MAAYRPPLESRSASQHLLCDFNERISPIGSYVQKALLDYIGRNEFQVYPSYGDSVSKLAVYAEVNPAQVMLTNGSDQGIELIFRANCREKDEVIVPLPSFAYYKHVAEVEGVNAIYPHYSKEHGFPTQEVLDKISEKTALVVIGNPNNPTGNSVKVEEILAILDKSAQTAVLVDECYFEYTRITVKDYLEKYPNLFITRTFSKTWGLPSLRIGYILSAEENIQHLLKVRGPYDVNKLGVIAMEAAITKPKEMQSYVDEVLQISMPKLLRFLDSKSVPYWPPTANFVLTFPKDPNRVLTGLQEMNILVRPQRGPGIDGAVRMSVGLSQHTEKLIAALEKLL